MIRIMMPAGMDCMIVAFGAGSPYHSRRPSFTTG